MLEQVNIGIWIAVTTAVYAALSFYVVRLQNQYSEQFQQTKVSFKQSLPSLIVGGAALIVLCALARNRLSQECFIALAIAAASLRGVYLVDRQLLIIPDRLQLLGLCGGLLYVVFLIRSGEDMKMVLLETGFSLLMVVLLWVLSFIYLKLRQSVGFGMGDIKLLGWLSFFVGKRMADVILMAIACGLIHLFLVAVKNSLKEKKLVLPKGQEAFAFGPSIVIGVVLESMVNYV